MAENKYEKLVETIIGGDHLDIDTLIELMLKSDWTADDVANELGEDFYIETRIAQISENKHKRTNKWVEKS